MNTLDIHATIAAERRDLARILSELTPQQWEAPSLCEGWRVAEVVAHMTMPFRFSVGAFIWGMIKAGGRFNTLADRSARQDTARLSTAQLLESLQDNIDYRWKPPGGGYEGALSHDVIHGLDITVALGLNRMVPLERLRIVLAGVNAKNLTYFGVDLTDVTLVATDLDWSMGEGSPVEGSAQHILLAISGRKLPVGSLSGEHSRRFTAL